MNAFFAFESNVRKLKMSERELLEIYVSMRVKLPAAAAGAIVKALRKINRAHDLEENRVVLGSIGWGDGHWYVPRSQFSAPLRMTLCEDEESPAAYINRPILGINAPMRERAAPPRKLRAEDLGIVPRDRRFKK